MDISIDKPGKASAVTRHPRLIRAWLYGMAALVFLMVIVGGATRLTESGLSIVEWKPVTGTLPPLGEAAWQVEFDKYKTIPQYRERNQGMTLGEFKTIYWWEWAHRLLGRLIGAAFLLPFLFFLARGWVGPGLRARLWGIFGLGAFQGAVGWWMVYSGLADRTEVSQYRLATHLLIACAIFAAMIWTALRMDARPALASVGPKLRGVAATLLALIFLQIYLGALVAGLRAGLTYNTWPLLDGSVIPPPGELFAMTPSWRNFFENALTVQFDHRMAAYLVWALAVWHAFDARRSESGEASEGARLIALLATAQVLAGVVTLVYAVPIGWALVHQGLAIILLAAAVWHLARIAPQRNAPRLG